MKFFTIKTSFNIFIALVILNSIMRVCTYVVNSAGWRRVGRFVTLHGISSAKSNQVYNVQSLNELSSVIDSIIMSNI